LNQARSDCRDPSLALAERISVDIPGQLAGEVEAGCPHEQRVDPDESEEVGNTLL
jgi:hypothetical protein